MKTELCRRLSLTDLPPPTDKTLPATTRRRALSAMGRVESTAFRKEPIKASCCWPHRPYRKYRDEVGYLDNALAQPYPRQRSTHPLLCEEQERYKKRFIDAAVTAKAWRELEAEYALSPQGAGFHIELWRSAVLSLRNGAFERGLALMRAGYALTRDPVVQCNVMFESLMATSPVMQAGWRLASYAADATSDELFEPHFFQTVYATLVREALARSIAGRPLRTLGQDRTRHHECERRDVWRAQLLCRFL